MEHHPYRLRPYHNPQNVDESKVPAGWRFRYADEAGTPATTPCTPWLTNRFCWLTDFNGTLFRHTYIVPVDA
jgi:hypothetical protein